MIKQSNHMVAPVKKEHSDLAHTMIQRIRNEQPSSQHIGDLTSLVIDLTEAGMKFYFIESLERLEVSAITMGIAKVGISSTISGMKMVITKVLKKLNDEQVVKLSDFLEEILHRVN
jgi:hypothetical protein